MSLRFVEYRPYCPEGLNEEWLQTDVYSWILNCIPNSKDDNSAIDSSISYTLKLGGIAGGVLLIIFLLSIFYSKKIVRRYHVRARKNTEELPRFI